MNTIIKKVTPWAVTLGVAGSIMHDIPPSTHDAHEETLRIETHINDSGWLANMLANGSTNVPITGGVSLLRVPPAG
jgi:hypothetical protein